MARSVALYDEFFELRRNVSGKSRPGNASGEIDMADERIFISGAWCEYLTISGRFKSFPKIGSLQSIRKKRS